MTNELHEKLLRFGEEAEPFDHTIGLQLLSVEDGAATVLLRALEKNTNRWGNPHGGALFGLCDVACGMAALTVRQEVCVTVSSSIDFLTVGKGALTAVGRVDRAGGRLCFCSAEVRDEKNTLVAKGHAVMCFTGEALTL